MALIKKPATVQIPEALWERVVQYEGGKYTPKSVVITAIEEWLDAKAARAAERELERTPASPVVEEIVSRGDAS